MVAMEEIYGEATQGYEVPETIASRIRGLIRDAWGLEITLSGLGIFVEALPQPPYGVRKVIGRFSSLLEAQNFAWAWLTGPWGVAKDVRFAKVRSNLYEVDLDVLVRDVQAYLEGRSKGGL